MASSLRQELNYDILSQPFYNDLLITGSQERYSSMPTDKGQLQTWFNPEGMSVFLSGMNVTP